MKTHWFDLIALALLALSIISGFRKGLLATLFSIVGYIVGGVLALYFAVDFVKNREDNLTKFFILGAAIVIGAALGSAILGRLGSVLHKRVLFAPLKLIDSLLGAALSGIRTLIFIFLFAQLAIVMPWSWAHNYVAPSTVYQKLNEHAPQIIKSVTNKISNLHSSPTGDLLG